MDRSSIPKATDPSDRGMGSPSEGRAATAEPAGVRARDALREQSVFLEQAQESVGLGYWVLDLEREVLLSWSPEAHRIYGTTPAEFDGKMETIWRLVHPGDASRISDAFTTALEGGAPYRIEHRIVRRDGTLRWIMSAANIQRDDTGMPKQAAGICQDITDRKRGEDEIRAAADYNRSLIEASLNPMVTIGADGRITDINDATEQITGLARAELLGTEFSDYFTEPDLARAGYEQAFRDGSVRDYPLELRHRDGHITAVLYNASVYRDPEYSGSWPQPGTSRRPSACRRRCASPNSGSAPYSTTPRSASAGWRSAATWFGSTAVSARFSATPPTRCSPCGGSRTSWFPTISRPISPPSNASCPARSTPIRRRDASGERAVA
jgi:PAS domain S-box-containing protein